VFFLEKGPFFPPAKNLSPPAPNSGGPKKKRSARGGGGGGGKMGGQNRGGPPRSKRPGPKIGAGQHRNTAARKRKRRLHLVEGSLRVYRDPGTGRPIGYLNLVAISPTAACRRTPAIRLFAPWKPWSVVDASPASPTAGASTTRCLRSGAGPCAKPAAFPAPDRCRHFKRITIPYGHVRGDSCSSRSPSRHWTSSCPGDWFPAMAAKSSPCCCPAPTKRGNGGRRGYLPNRPQSPFPTKATRQASSRFQSAALRSSRSEERTRLDLIESADKPSIAQRAGRNRVVMASTPTRTDAPRPSRSAQDYRVSDPVE